MTHSFNKHDITRDACMLRGPLRRQGYDWWWHSLTARDENGAEKPFFIECSAYSFHTSNFALQQYNMMNLH